MRSVTINGRLGPCIDIYDVPSDSSTPIAQDIFVHRLPDIPLVASFQLPLLADRHQGCIWTRSESRTSVSDFYMRIGQPCESTAICDQLVTFGLYGEYRATRESFQGVVSISRLEDILMRESEARGIKIPTSLQISWNHWSSAVSLQKIKSSALVPKPNNTLIARLCRSSNDASHAVMVIRDYNQQLIHAPSGHMTQRLGQHPKTSVLYEQHSFDQFEVVNETKSLSSSLFVGKSVTYGLGYRTRTIDMGEYSPNTTTSTVNWYEDEIRIVADTGNVSILVPGNQYKDY